MKVVKAALAEPFVFTTGLAALAHSTWALGTLFSGPEPDQFTGAWFAWIVPALLIAFSLDVGQIATSYKIRTGERNKGRYITFATFSIATYYLQWLYISHHMPMVSLGTGVESWSLGISELLRGAAQWIIPALLPLSTLLYTLSGSDENQVPVVTIEEPEPLPEPAPVSPPQTIPAPKLPELPKVTQPLIAAPVSPLTVQCERCGWSKTFGDPNIAKRALDLHLQGCTVGVTPQ